MTPEIKKQAPSRPAALPPSVLALRERAASGCWPEIAL